MDQGFSGIHDHILVVVKGDRHGWCHIAVSELSARRGSERRWYPKLHVLASVANESRTLVATPVAEAGRRTWPSGARRAERASQVIL
jgi:hypothetical protein